MSNIGYKSSSAEIIDHAAYDRGRQRRIIENALKTWHKNTERANEIWHWVHSSSMEGNKFASSLEVNFAQWGKLSEKQSAAVLKIIDADNARKAEWAEKAKAEREAAEDVPEGKQQITGTVISVKDRASGYGTVVFKMLVKDDRGFKVWGTVPQAIWDAVGEERVTGQRVTFSATITQSPDDEKFGFFKRPTKAGLA